ncbi:MAG: hypothetical protein HN778_02195 [Prolixibacteraceae bacterium]|jgi:photosystem II stability/assembly factor-like uncharacterized protein|nr:hypothetical protein [Prolixibacteraceae bacterium]MBT6004342.1 hypothetical protein [Prolixibacteraceae bacterium]MBT6764612.1 hypothetical protein [Prolixibacteraceae bacterium]MBT6999579.1 hypothetical protein [Prolixibacteraceae bacterium]MBT7393622.1 hypothetical protein [Prolixibacteraceae bacterium]
MKNLLIALILFSFLVSSCTNKNTQHKLKFSKIETKTDASLRGLFVVDENIVWASGSKGIVLVSKDGGENWNVNQIHGAEENDFRSIYAWDENRAMVFGVAGPQFGFLTEDGGENWEVVFQDSTEGLFFNSLKFADVKNGLAVSDPIDGKFFVIRTEDGGKKWERVSDIPNVVEGEANFAASNTCIEFLPSGKAWIASGGFAARVFYSNDFGKSWEVSKTPMVSGQASSGIFSISFKNDLEGVIVGGTYDKAELNQNIASFTEDGGKTWQISETMPNEYRSCVQFVSNEKNELLFAIGKTGCDISTDKGKNWKFISENGYYTFKAVPGKLAGFVAGNNGNIAKVEFKGN